MDIEAVSFDLWQTLIFDNPSLSEERATLRLEGMAKVLNQTAPVDHEELALALRTWSGSR